MNQSAFSIAQQDRTMAALTHLSGLAGYVVPLCGVIVPGIIWMVNRESPLISSIAKQAVFLNVIAFVLIGASAILLITVILIPAVFLFWMFLAVVVVALPIIGAIKANQGIYYRYPVVGVEPMAR